MAAEKKSYTLKATLQSAEIAVGDELVTFTEGSSYETDDPREQTILDAFAAVKLTETKPAKQTKGEES